MDTRNATTVPTRQPDKARSAVKAGTADSYSLVYDTAIHAWTVVVWIDGVGHYLGHFRTESLAKKAAKQKSA